MQSIPLPRLSHATQSAEYWPVLLTECVGVDAVFAALPLACIGWERSRQCGGKRASVRACDGSGSSRQSHRPSISEHCPFGAEDVRIDVRSVNGVFPHEIDRQTPQLPELEHRP